LDISIKLEILIYLLSHILDILEAQQIGREGDQALIPFIPLIVFDWDPISEMNGEA